MPLGTDTLVRIAEKHALVEKELVRWRELSRSTDFEGAANPTSA